MRRNVVSVDQETGEVMDGALVWVSQRAKIREGWFMGFQEAFLELAKDVELAGQPMRVLLVLMSKLDWENFIAFSQGDIAKQLKIRPEAVSRAVRLLREKGVIEAGPVLGNTKTYKLNPGYAWRGSVSNLHKARAHRLSLAIDNGKGKRT